MDNQSFEDIEKEGLRFFVENIQEDLINRTYRSRAVRQVLIPKEKKGEFRKLVHGELNTDTLKPAYRSGRLVLFNLLRAEEPCK